MLINIKIMFCYRITMDVKNDFKTKRNKFLQLILIIQVENFYNVINISNAIKDYFEKYWKI